MSSLASFRRTKPAVAAEQAAGQESAQERQRVLEKQHAAVDSDTSSGDEAPSSAGDDKQLVVQEVTHSLSLIVESGNCRFVPAQLCRPTWLAGCSGTSGLR